MNPWLTKESFHESIVLRKLGWEWGWGWGCVPEPSETSLWAWGCQEHTCPRSDSEPQSSALSSVPLPSGASPSPGTCCTPGLGRTESREGGCRAPIWAPSLSLPSCEAAPHIITSQ